MVTVAAAIGLATVIASGADALAFSGAFSNTNPPAAPGGRCATLTVTIGNVAPFFATGTSNFGNFTGSQSHCIDTAPPVAVGAPDVPYYDGRFVYSFASGDTLTGTYSGLLTNAGMGIVGNVQNFIVTGGSGLFAAATGSFLGTGQLRFTGGPPSATLTISRGVINVAAVPEPASWALLIAGFGTTGVALRRRRTVAA